MHSHSHDSHGHGHAHGGGHSHHHVHTDGESAFRLSVGLNIGFVAIEAAAGFWYDSLALLADAGHNLSDVLGLILAWGALRLSRLAPDGRHTYGYGRSTILAALLNAALLLVAVGVLAWEAWNRLGQPVAVPGVPLMLVAGVGIAINGWSAALFWARQRHDLNARGAFLHMLADTAVSAAVVLGGALIYFTNWSWIDPALGLAVALAIFAGTFGLLRDSLAASLDAVPSHIDPEAVRAFLASQPGVIAVHDLHIWPLSTNSTALTAHLVLAGIAPGEGMLARLGAELHEKFDIDHSTIQIESPHDAQRCTMEHGAHA